MQTLIFEGIATSGKSTVTNKLAEALSPRLSVRLATEDETHVPIMDARQGLHLQFFESLLTTMASKQPDLLILDRLYMTQAFRAKCDLSAYKGFEEFLLQYNPTTIFLKVSETEIPNRIHIATKHRNPSWAEYVQSRGQD